MAPLHLLMATMKNGRMKEIITTEGVGEGGREGEEGEGVATMEAAGVVAMVMTTAMVAEAGTMKSRMNTMTSPKNMARLLAAGVAGEEGVRHPGVGVVAQAVGHHVAAEVATISLRSTSCQVGGVLKQSTAVLSYPLAFALHVILWSLPDWNGPIWYPLFQMLLYFLLLCCAVPVRLVGQVFVARSWFCS
ncbi:unnamed protein product [Urochloa humidicola]